MGSLTWTAPCGRALCALVLVAAIAPAHAGADHPAGSCLDVSPDIRRAAGSVSLTATLREANQPLPGRCGGAAVTATAPAGVVARFEITSGPHANSDPTGPDATCTISSSPATATCTATYAARSVGGTDTVRAWIDVPDVAEGRDADADPPNPAHFGTALEPDATDVLDVDLRAAVTVSGADHGTVGACTPVVVTVTNGASPVPEAASGVIVDVEAIHERAGDERARNEPAVSFCSPSPDAANPSAVDASRGDRVEVPDNLGTAGGEAVTATDAQGRVTVGVRVDPAQGSDGTGRVDITVFVEDAAADDDPGPGEPADPMERTFVAPAARAIDCEPEASTGPTDTPHLVRCVVRDRFGAPLPGVGVSFASAGPGRIAAPVGGTATTDAAGEVAATLRSTAPGSQVLTTTITDDLADSPDIPGAEPDEVDDCDRGAGDPAGAAAGVCSDPVQRTWRDDGPQPECNDGVDNDADGTVDYPADAGCTGVDDDSEDERAKVETEVTLRHHADPHVFAGAVTAVDAACVGARVVAIKKVRAGSDRAVGRGTTGADGRFRVRHTTGGRGRYYAVVARRRIDGGVTCRAATGQTIVVRR